MTRTSVGIQRSLQHNVITLQDKDKNATAGDMEGIYLLLRSLGRLEDGLEGLGNMTSGCQSAMASMLLRLLDKTLFFFTSVIPKGNA